MKRDFKRILDEWPFQPDIVNARWIEGDDGRPKVQLRLDLGILQMEIDGRPDGTRPHGRASLVDYYHDIENQTHYEIPELVLGASECAALQQEAVQYYYRYLSFAALQFHEGVVRDTQHNLDLFDIVDQYAEDDEYAWQFLQFYPYVVMMNARAKAELYMGEGRYDTATEIVRDALGSIRHFAEINDLEDEDPENMYEMEVLLDLMAHIEEHRPKKKSDKLRERMQNAIRRENYEEAAKIRDLLKTLTKKN